MRGPCKAHNKQLLLTYETTVLGYCLFFGGSSLLDRRGYSHLKEEALDRTTWRNRFSGGFGPVVRQNTE